MWNFASSASAHACASGVREVIVSGVRSWRAKGAGLRRERLSIGGDLAGDGARRHLPVLDRIDRRAGHAIEDEDVPVLGRLRDGVDRLAVAPDRDEARRRGRVAIPDVVAHELEVPDELSRVGVEREQRVRVEVVANAVGAVEIGRRRSRRHVDDAARLVERHARPAVGAAVLAPRVLRPRLVAGLAWMRNGVKAPLQRAGACVVGADIARRRGQSFGHAPAEDQQVFVDDARRW